MRQRRNSFILLILLVATIVGFWFLVQTTPERIISLVYLTLICVYAFLTYRDDVLGASVAFFAAVDLNHYLFNQTLPLWTVNLCLISIAFLLWLVLFGRSGWFLATVSVVLALEMLLAIQFTNLSLTVQALLTIAPFIVSFQYYYFQRHRPDY